MGGWEDEGIREWGDAGGCGDAGMREKEMGKRRNGEQKMRYG